MNTPASDPLDCEECVSGALEHIHAALSTHAAKDSTA